MDHHHHHPFHHQLVLTEPILITLFLFLPSSLSLSLSLSLSPVFPYRSSFMADPLDCFQWLYRANESKSCRSPALVFVFMCNSSLKSKRHLWVLPYFLNRSQDVSFVLLVWFVRWEPCGRTVAVLWWAAFRICLKKYVEFWCRFFLKHFIRVQVVHPYNSTDTVTCSKKSGFILSERSDFYMIDGSISIVDYACWHHFQ